MRNKRTNIIGVIVPKISSSFFSNFISQIEKVAASSDFKILIFQSFDDFQKEKENIVQLNDGTVDGLIILSNNRFSKDDFEVDLLANVLVVHYQKEEAFDKLILKRLALSSFEEILSVIS